MWLGGGRGRAAGPPVGRMHFPLGPRICAAEPASGLFRGSPLSCSSQGCVCRTPGGVQFWEHSAQGSATRKGWGGRWRLALLATRRLSGGGMLQRFPATELCPLHKGWACWAQEWHQVALPAGERLPHPPPPGAVAPTPKLQCTRPLSLGGVQPASNLQDCSLYCPSVPRIRAAWVTFSVPNPATHPRAGASALLDCRSELHSSGQGSSSKSRLGYSWRSFGQGWRG